MWNSKWEYENQAYLKERYEKKMSGELPYHPVRKIICKGCGREFYTQIKGKKYCYYYLCGNRGYRKELPERAREARQDRICKVCGKVFTPKNRTAFIAPTLADRKLTAGVLRITECSKRTLAYP